jgi:2-amino-4-hydroxy-6-hydroxymethyldihydropteridine diphosphokinase
MTAGGIYIALGSNLGDRAAHIEAALVELKSAGDIRVLRRSTLHETVPVGGPPGQDAYLNAVAELATDLSPHELLDRLLLIEQHHGRERHVRNGARTLDLDLLLYHRERITAADLVIPHPRMWQRSFVLEPLAEICPPARLAALRRWADPTGAAACILT